MGFGLRWLHVLLVVVIDAVFGADLAVFGFIGFQVWVVCRWLCGVRILVGLRVG